MNGGSRCFFFGVFSVSSTGFCNPQSVVFIGDFPVFKNRSSPTNNPIKNVIFPYDPICKKFIKNLKRLCVGLWNMGGFSSYLFGMSEVIAKQSNEENAAENTKNSTLTWLIGFLFVVSFLGLFSVLPLRKVLHF